MCDKIQLVFCCLYSKRSFDGKKELKLPKVVSKNDWIQLVHVSYKYFIPNWVDFSIKSPKILKCFIWQVFFYQFRLIIKMIYLKMQDRTITCEYPCLIFPIEGCTYNLLCHLRIFFLPRCKSIELIFPNTLKFNLRINRNTF